MDILARNDPRRTRRRIRIPAAKGTPALWVRPAREIPYPVEQVRSITLLCEGGRLFLGTPPPETR
ncbi:hypothetical protein ACGF5C_30415 [Micromonospora sp. NPDC047620]|uniref:hypothetical protein n=1 Tax=Micromonospora sp. NPDC047620 TaxID=3364251 RepID=UPI0037193B95